MATLMHVASGREHPLLSITRIGRDPDADLTLSDPSTSRQHATLRWRDGRWEVDDHGSANGTWLHGVRLTPGEPEPVASHSEIRFGEERAVFRLTDAGPPAPAARSGARRVVGEGERLPFEEGGQIVATVERGTDGVWTFRSGATRVVVAHGTEVEVQRRRWTLVLPEGPDATVQYTVEQAVEAELTIELEWSLDEEHVTVHLVRGRERKTLTPSVYHAVVLTLARVQWDDAEKGVPEEERGWADVALLCQELAMDRRELNTAVHRVRGKVRNLDPAEADLFERRTGQVRLRVPASTPR